MTLFQVKSCQAVGLAIKLLLIIILLYHLKFLMSMMNAMLLGRQGAVSINKIIVLLQHVTSFEFCTVIQRIIFTVKSMTNTYLF